MADPDQAEERMDAVARDLRRRSWRTRPGRRCSTSSASPCTRRGSAATRRIFVDPSTSRSTTTTSTPRMPSSHAPHHPPRTSHHFGWDNANQPALDGGARRHGRVRDRRRLGRPARAELDRRRRRRRSISPRSIRSPARSMSTAPSRATRSRSRSCRFAPSGWGWTANIPGFGLLADQFTEPALHIWNYDAGDASRRPRTGPAGACR